MTRNSLRAQLSGMSLRQSGYSTASLQHPDIPVSSPPSALVERELSSEEKCLILGDMNGFAKMTCETCRINLVNQGRTMAFSSLGACRICAVREGKPEAFTEPFCDFLTKNPTIFHAVDYFKKKMEALGFKEVRKAAQYMLVCGLSSVC